MAACRCYHLMCIITQRLLSLQCSSADLFLEVGAVPNKRPGGVAFFKHGHLFESNFERENPYKITIKS